MQSYYVKTWEELRQLPGFNPAIDKAQLSQATIVARYEMSEQGRMEPCGIRQCRTNHRKGYIVGLGESSISHVGHRCGAKHFGEHRWKVELRRHRRIEQAFAEQRAAKEAAEAARGTIASHPAQLPGMEVTRRLLTAFDALPSQLRDSILARANDNDPIITRLRPVTDAERKQMEFGGRKVIPVDVEEPIGQLSGLPGLRQSHRADMLWERDIPALLLRLRSAADQRDAEVLLTVTRSYKTSMRRLEASIRDTALFFEQSNLDLLSKLQAARRLGISRVVRSTTDALVIERSG